ncbi:hypothetical protein BDP81DRAFT_390897 [Colletotrichum phormii]|uniref:EC87 protein n=1 Tax=Colletotrichum phormii TaxID=359342 RepID=A0AAI9ZXT0_9PEZI|nr:uncharacterized protein BDP81DRAFT_390897 [Colletotrichum phormii]KAK1640156.1 hypothetical protein BDP81DRAFT_390897 [Colletotrichum phormii]
MNFDFIRFKRLELIQSPRNCQTPGSFKPPSKSATMRGTFFTVFALVAAVAAQAPYTGSCSDTACGVESENCDAQGRQCFPFPNIAPALREGCVCGSG